MRAAFIGGCDRFVDKTLLGGVRTVEEGETRIQGLAEDTQGNSTRVTEDILRHVEITAATTRILLLKCQEVQVCTTISAKMRTILLLLLLLLVVVVVVVLFLLLVVVLLYVAKYVPGMYNHFY